MNAPASKRTYAEKTGWLIMLLTVGWLAFMFVPFPGNKEAAPLVAPVVVDSKLRAVGLTDNVDWEGLPEIFAVWADRADWVNGRTRFAYWHPVMKTYSYFFEAVQVEGGYRFREIAEPHDENYYWDDNLSEDCPIRFFYSYSSSQIVWADGWEEPNKATFSKPFRKPTVDIKVEHNQMPSLPQMKAQPSKSER